MVRWEFIILIVVFLILGNYSWNDVVNVVKNLGSNLLPNYQFLGMLIIIFILLFIAFTYEILGFFRKIKNRIKEKI